MKLIVMGTNHIRLEILTLSFKNDHTQQGCDYTLPSSLFENKEIFSVLSGRQGKWAHFDVHRRPTVGVSRRKNILHPCFCPWGSLIFERSPETYPQVSGHSPESQAP